MCVSYEESEQNIDDKSAKKCPNEDGSESWSKSKSLLAEKRARKARIKAELERSPGGV